VAKVYIVDFRGSTSVGIVYTRGQLGSIIQVKRIGGKLFGSKEQAEQDGVELCKEWVDTQKVLNLNLSVALAK
jgi:hypothetical protein